MEGPQKQHRILRGPVHEVRFQFLELNGSLSLLTPKPRLRLLTDHIKKKAFRYTFAEWKAIAAKKPKRKSGPLTKTGLKSEIAGYPVEQYVHIHKDGTTGESWVTSQLPLSPLLLQTIGDLCSGQPLDDQVAQFVRQGLVTMKTVRKSADGSVVFQNEITEVRSQSLSEDLFKVSDPT